MELMSLKKGKEETIKDFVKRYRKTSLELDALNHLQALNGLKEEEKIARSWYNSRAPTIN